MSIRRFVPRWFYAITLLLVATASAASWTALGPQADASNIVVDPSTRDVFVVKSAGNNQSLYRRLGAAWSLVPPPPAPVTSFIIPGNGTIFALPGSGAGDTLVIYRTTDNGGTWQSVSWPSNLQEIVADPSNATTLYGIVYGVGVYKSVDDGTSWTSLPSGWPTQFGLFGVLVDRTNPATIYAWGLGFQKSVDGGAHWSTVGAGLPGVPFVAATVVRQVIQVGATLIAATFRSGVYRSTDGGATWTASAAGLPASASNVLLVASPGASPALYGVTGSAMYRSNDGAASWSPVSVPPPQPTVVVLDPQGANVAYAVTSTGLYVSTDGLASWNPVSVGSGLPGPSVSEVDVDNGNADKLIVHTAGAQFKSDDGGGHWVQYAPPGGDTGIEIIRSPNARPGTLYGLSSMFTNQTAILFTFTLWRSRDDGQTWSSILVLGPTKSFTPSVVLEGRPETTTIYLAGVATGGVLLPPLPDVHRSDDDGAHWAGGGPPISVNGVGDVRFIVDPRDDLTLYAAGTEGLFRSTDGAAHWSRIGVSPALPFPSVTPSGANQGRIVPTGLLVDPSHPDTLYASWAHTNGIPDFGIYKSTDRGNTWFPINQGMPSLAITTLALDRNDPSTIYAGTAADGVWATNDGGKHWSSLDALPSASAMAVNDVEVDPVGGRTVYAASQAGLYSLALALPTAYLPAIEYYAPSLDHYFVTSEAQADLAALDGGAIPGWIRTGRTFRVSPLGTAGRSAVCRFFSGQSFAPKSSHFYTPYPDECAALRAQGIWQHEGEVFALGLPAGSPGQGMCGSGDSPLYRLYNNGLGGAPNHRYTDDPALVNAMIALGWVFEGEAQTRVFACKPITP